MSTDLIEYGLRVSTIWLLLLGYYFIWGRKTGFRFQRVMLLGGWILGLAIPMLPALETASPLAMANLPSISLAPTMTTTTTAIEATPVTSGWHWTEVLSLLYLLGVLFFGARALVQSWWIQQCLVDGKQSSYAGYPVITSSKIKSPFTARSYVFLPKELDPDLTHTALLHETAHLRARHHYDKNLMTLGSILLWFHPLMWAYRRLLATIHEYEADAAVVQTVPVRTYGLQLLHCSLGPTGRLGLFSSPLKQRIDMITSSSPKGKKHILPVITLALLLATLTFACSDIGQNLTPSEEPTSLEISTQIPFLQLAPSSAVDEYPRLIGAENTTLPGEKILVDAIATKLKYPEDALKMAYEGKVQAWVGINADGTINGVESLYREISGDKKANSPTNIKISSLKPTETNPLPDNVRHSVLVEEVARAMESLGNFHPITAKGKPTPVIIEFFVDFQLSK